MTAHFHLPGLFEFYDLYRAFLPLYRNHREWFYDWCDIASIYGSPSDCLWGGGRVGFGEADAEEVFELMKEFGISSRLTFSNSLLKEEHLSDKKCNELCRLFENAPVKNGVIVYSDLLLDYLKRKFPGFYFVSSTTKVLTDFSDFKMELARNDFSFVVPDFRLNKKIEKLEALDEGLKNKVEFLCNECCSPFCQERKICYENVSRKNLGLECSDHHCAAPDGDTGYRFSSAMKSPLFIGIDDIQNKYLKMGFSNFKIEGRGLGSAMVLEFLLYYLVRPKYQINVREEIYLDGMLDLF